MSGKKSKLLRRKAENLLIEWVRSMTPEGEDSTKLTRKNLHEILPEQTHLFGNNKLMLSAYSLRWFYKQVKKNPNFHLEELNG
jgi:hypothetical protein|tara:strand:+ start:831 stop:1079 length:249 start_codon:yes stop_codon:yes gene_type:complete